MKYTHEEKIASLEKVLTPRTPTDETLIMNPTYTQADDDTLDYKVYEAVSEAMQQSDLSFDFAYLVAYEAINEIVNMDNWNIDNDTTMDELREKCDSATPIYNHEIVQIYTNNWQLVDEIAEEYGTPKPFSSIQLAQLAWGRAIEDMARAIITNMSTI